MAVPLLARASVAQSLVRTIGKAKTPASAELIALLRADDGAQAIMSMPPITWVEEKPFLALLALAHQHLGETTYVEMVHGASVAMLKHGIFRSAQRAFTLFRRPSISAYSVWAQRMWALSFNGLALDHDGEDPVEGVRMVLSRPPASGFTRPIVYGAVGVLHTVFSFARVEGTVSVLPHRTEDAVVHLRVLAGKGR
jgi:hypothetical protein